MASHLDEVGVLEELVEGQRHRQRALVAVPEAEGPLVEEDAQILPSFSTGKCFLYSSQASAMVAIRCAGWRAHSVSVC